MCGRSKSPITTSGSRSPSRRQISLPHRRRRGGGERDPHGRAELVGLRAEPQVVGPEVPSPLADEVRLVDDEQPGPGAPQRRAGLVVGQLLGREEDEFVGPAGLDERRRPRTRRLRGVEHRGRQARRLEVRQLVVLERDQRRHDDRGAAAQQAGQLVDRRLAAAGGQDREHVPARRRGGDRLLLARPQPLEPEPFARELADPHVALGRHVGMTVRRHGSSSNRDSRAFDWAMRTNPGSAAGVNRRR